MSTAKKVLIAISVISILVTLVTGFMMATGVLTLGEIPKGGGDDDTIIVAGGSMHVKTAVGFDYLAAKQASHHHKNRIVRSILYGPKDGPYRVATIPLGAFDINLKYCADPKCGQSETVTLSVGFFHKNLTIHNDGTYGVGDEAKAAADAGYKNWDHKPDGYLASIAIKGNDTYDCGPDKGLCVVSVSYHCAQLPNGTNPEPCK